MVNGRHYEVSEDVASVLVRRGIAVIFGENVTEDKGVVAGSTVTLKQVGEVKKSEPNIDELIAAKQKQFNDAKDKTTKNQYRKELNDLKKQKTRE